MITPQPPDGPPIYVINVRGQIVKWALRGVDQRGYFEYEEVRPLSLVWPPAHVKTDCSWFVKLVYWKACAKDPTGFNYSGYGNSDSLFQHGRHITRGQLKPGDVITFGPGGSVHAVIAVQVGPDPLCSSMGKPGDPSLVRLSVLESLGEPTFLRFSTLNRRIL